MQASEDIGHVAASIFGVCNPLILAAVEMV